MKVLLVYSKCHDSFWGFSHVLKFISKKTAVPPLGLITVSAMLPDTWQKKLADINISPLQTSDVQWVDYVFISAIYIQKESVNNVIFESKKWMQSHKYPFKFSIQSSINLADDKELMSQLNDVGINAAFIGIETPDELSLQACNKVQNKNREVIQSVKQIQQAGIQVSGGFIVGFDSDKPTVFQRQTDFIQQSGIVSAMGGLLTPPKTIKLYYQIEAENRLTTESTENNTDSSMNFIPKMDNNELQQVYKKIIHSIYSAKPYYKRIRQLLLNYNRLAKEQSKIRFSLIKPFIKSAYVIGFLNKGRSEYWKFLIWILFNKPKLMVEAITYSVDGYHFRTVYGLKQIQRKN